MPVYSASSNQWPLLQSLNEVKHKSGLFTCTATFIRPVGNTHLPTVIETSIGDVDVWPEPVVSTGTDAFQTISATGYGVWDASISEATFSRDIGSLPVQWSRMEYCKNSDGCDEVPCGGIVDEYFRVKYMPVIVESVYVRKIGDSLPPIPARVPADTESTETESTLKIQDITGQDISQTEFNISEFDDFVSPSGYNGQFNKKITLLILPTMVKKNTYGEIVETEVVYSIVLDGAATQINYGTFYSIINC
jgi:hypothetical protein